ncbi:KAP family P-loop NTPase fold protein [Massilia soli]|uniref:KAP family NTPase n=1 Tax=Massilia soli TaxID=2792854 RepID=A0ABS7SMM1_9BURK|nr:P-loop NTPase fold protein [Massilia soli]MBZ2207121.1 KAP family NTPase [Massilia soli]
MTSRIHEIEVPDENPFLNDVLNRKEVVDFLAKLVGRTTGPFVLAIDSEWGTGKTTLIAMLQAVLRKENFQCVHFNAWKADYVADPLVPMVSAINQIQLPAGEAAKTFSDRLQTIKKGTGVLAKRGLIAGIKVATLGVLDVESDVEAIAAELTGATANDLVERFEQENEILTKFRSDLESAVEQLAAAGKQKNLIFFIDELDRCRPDFAITLLERVKHLFDVPHIVFVLSIDKRQLEASTAAVYGSGINAPEYLRRFIDLELGLPTIGGKPFTDLILKRTGLDEVFAERTSNAELQYDREHFVRYFTQLADLCQLTLRARERCATRLMIVMHQTPPNHYLDPIVVAVLLVLRTIKPSLFRQIVEGVAGTKEIMEYLYTLPAAEKIATDRAGAVIEAELLAADHDSRRDDRAKELADIAQDEKRGAADRQYARNVLELISYPGRSSRSAMRMRSIAGKVDMAALTRGRG